METIKNRFSELQTSWTSHKHPNNSEYMQCVNYMHIESANGKSRLFWSLSNSNENDKHVIYDISLTEAKLKFMDSDENLITELDFEKWLSTKK